MQLEQAGRRSAAAGRRAHGALSGWGGNLHVRSNHFFNPGREDTPHHILTVLTTAPWLRQGAPGASPRLWALCCSTVLAVAHLLLPIPAPIQATAMALERIASACVGLQVRRPRTLRNGPAACSQSTCSPRRRPLTRASGAWRRSGRFERTSCLTACGADSGTPGKTAAARKAVLACRRVP